MCMSIKIKNNSKKIRVNITVDKAALTKAKKKLNMFGGKLSTLFNAYLSDFVSSMDKNITKDKLQTQIDEMHSRLKKLESKR